VSGTRTIKVEALSRVEGEGGLHVSFQGDLVQEVRLSIYEPPRFFEAFLQGRPLTEVPDIVARICGICPIAYQMSSVHALERALGVVTGPEIRRLRRLLYCGEWIESHALHIHLLHAPDFFGCDSGLELVEHCRDEFQRGLRLKKHGNQLLEMLGGRAIHPVNVAVGGFYRAPRREEVAPLIPAFEWGLEAAVETTRWVAGFNFPDFERPYEMVSLSHPDEYPMNEGRIASTSGLSIHVGEYERQFEERQVKHSTALHSVRRRGRFVAGASRPEQSTGTAPPKTGNSYLVGPLARVNLNFDCLSARARRVAAEIGFSVPCCNPFKAIIARSLELIHAYEEGLDILRTYRPFSPPRIEWIAKAGEGCAATEAPRGLIYHRYVVDAEGKVTFAKIVPPTSQNQSQIEDDLRAWLPGILSDDERQMALGCERLIRCYDPCISCSTHFLKLTVERIS
jgi:sulfhydrogenase subunit alpha